MVIVGHSMGGLLTKAMVSDSEEILLDAFLDSEKLTKKQIPDTEKEFLIELLTFKSLTFVKRVVFMATPHRGSEMADWSIARFGSSMISIPMKLNNKIHNIYNGMMIKAGLKEEELLPLEDVNGIAALKPSNPILQEMAKLPIQQGTEYHSVIGDEDQAGNKNGSDGIVPYHSSHIEGVESEIVIESGHSVQHKNAAIQEIKRILLKHLSLSGLEHKYEPGK
jgi:hypothetical protein